jgi:hypothetical protein
MAIKAQIPAKQKDFSVFFIALSAEVKNKQKAEPGAVFSIAFFWNLLPFSDCLTFNYSLLYTVHSASFSAFWSLVRPGPVRQM